MASRNEVFDGWDELIKQLGPQRFRERFRGRMAVAHRRVGKKFEQRTADIIADEQPFEPNAPLTEALKGSNVPLKNKGDLIGNLTHIVESPVELVMGVKSPRTKKGKPIYEVLHEGATIRVTKEMRLAIMVKLELGIATDATVGNTRADRSRHREWMEDARNAFDEFSGDGAAFWIIPPRPFITTTFEDKEWRTFAKREYDRAMRAILAKPKTSGGR